MSDHPHTNGASRCCAFCGRPLPVVGNLIQPWRSPTGLFFCNEFCADDAEEASFQNRRKPRRQDGEDRRWVAGNAG